MAKVADEVLVVPVGLVVLVAGVVPAAGAADLAEGGLAAGVVPVVPVVDAALAAVMADVVPAVRVVIVASSLICSRT